jgi:hypothetical protein
VLVRRRVEPRLCKGSGAHAVNDGEEGSGQSAAAKAALRSDPDAAKQSLKSTSRSRVTGVKP